MRREGASSKRKRSATSASSTGELSALVVVNDLGFRDRDGGLAAKEEDAAGTIDRVLRIEDTVDIAEPEEAECHDVAEPGRAGQCPDKRADRPPQRRAGTG